jgi:hypothetical protein
MLLKTSLRRVVNKQKRRNPRQRQNGPQGPFFLAVEKDLIVYDFIA